jgi:hypothetical protein
MWSYVLKSPKIAKINGVNFKMNDIHIPSDWFFDWVKTASHIRKKLRSSDHHLLSNKPERPRDHNLGIRIGDIYFSIHPVICARFAFGVKIIMNSLSSVKQYESSFSNFHNCLRASSIMWSCSPCAANLLLLNWHRIRSSILHWVVYMSQLPGLCGQKAPSFLFF